MPVKALVLPGHHQDLQGQGEILQHLAEGGNPPQHPLSSGHHQDHWDLRVEPELRIQRLPGRDLRELGVDRDAGDDDLGVGHTLMDQSLSHLLGADQVEVGCRVQPMAVRGVVRNHGDQRDVEQPLFLDVRDDAGHHRKGGDNQAG